MRSGWSVALAAVFLGTGLVRAQAGDVNVPVPVTYEPVKDANKTEPIPEPGKPAPLFGTPGCDHETVGPAEGFGQPESAPSRLWARADVLYWWIKDSNTPPLVTTGPAGSGAILGRGGETVFGGSIDNEGRWGGRFTAGSWLDCNGTCGLEASYLFLGSRSVHFITGSDGGPGTPVISRPFFNPITGAEDTQLIAAPGALAGTVVVNLTSRLQGAELNGVCGQCFCDGCLRLEALAGFRYLDLHEGLGIGEDLHVLPGVPGIGGTALSLFDQFDAVNRFYGGQIGGRARYKSGPWDAEVYAKVALGDSHERVTINGSTTIVTPAGVATTLPGGLLALSSNSGRFSRDSFAVVPEVNLSVGYWINCSLRVYAGYTFLYWSDVARPGDQIDRVVNPQLLPVTGTAGPVTGPARPSFVFKETDFWAQGVHVGLEVRF